MSDGGPSGSGGPTKHVGSAESAAMTKGINVRTRQKRNENQKLVDAAPKIELLSVLLYAKAIS